MWRSASFTGATWTPVPKDTQATCESQGVGFECKVSDERSGRGRECGFDFIQVGRALMFDTDVPKRAQERHTYKNGCNHCNKCATLIEAPGGSYCVERPANFG